MLFQAKASRNAADPRPSALPSDLAQRLPLRILVAEDNPTNVKVITFIMKRLGCRIDVAGNGLEAIAALQRQPYDVILVDIQMPVMNGFGFLDKFLEFPQEIQQHCKVIMFSSSVALEDQLSVKKYPVIRKFLAKPLTEQMFHDLDF